jgi:hypothetical protein
MHGNAFFGVFWGGRPEVLLGEGMERCVAPQERSLKHSEDTTNVIFFSHDVVCARVVRYIFSWTLTGMHDCTDVTAYDKERFV